MAVDKDKKTGENKSAPDGKKSRKMLIAAVFIVAAGIVGRIVYINYKLPSTKMHMVTQKFTGHEYDIAVNDALIYGKEQWIDYMEANLPEEEGFTAENYEFIPEAGDNYSMLLVELSVHNKTNKTVDTSHIRTGLVLMSGYKPLGYCMILQEKAPDSGVAKSREVEAGQTKDFLCVYVCKSEEEYNKDLMLQYCELGNNQRMKLEPGLAQQ